MEMWMIRVTIGEEYELIDKMEKNVEGQPVNRNVCVSTLPWLTNERLKGAEKTSERSETGCYCKSNKSYGIYYDNYIKPKEVSS